MAIMTEEELLNLAGLTQKAALRRHLRKAGIPFKEINGRLFTTEDAITATLCGHGKERRKAEPNFDALLKPAKRE